jgi:hypothetical protein
MRTTTMHRRWRGRAAAVLRALAAVAFVPVGSAQKTSTGFRGANGLAANYLR